MTPALAYQHFIQGMTLEQIAAATDSTPVEVAKAIGSHVDRQYMRFLR